MISHQLLTLMTRVTLSPPTSLLTDRVTVKPGSVFDVEYT
jgi:hypothetical protein